MPVSSKAEAIEMTSSTTENDNENELRHFADFDDEDTYERGKLLALDPNTRNFVVEFGKNEAYIAWDLRLGDVKSLLKAERSVERPVRWINIWAPNKQTEIVDLIGTHYKFSPRLLAIIRTVPPVPENARPRGKQAVGLKAKIYHKDDLEGAVVGRETPRSESSLGRQKPSSDASHYAIARKMKHYHSLDVGNKFLCIGANWMHELSSKKSEENLMFEGEQRALWSWLVLCDDHTVISLHEDLGPLQNREDIKSMRRNTLSVLTQLSTFGHDSADPISMQTVRQTLEEDIGGQCDASLEGASSLFYYLFDDWRAVYRTVSGFHYRLEELQTAIIGDIGRKSHQTANIEIIPRLHMLGRQFRQMEHLYQGYKNIISRILEQKASPSHHGLTTPRTLSGLSAHNRGVTLAQSAALRFERLSDRIELLILSEIKEFLAEKEALVATYFNITAQKDSEATARLTRAATLLAKLSVLFLPVSLMTGYFSIQISELSGVYTTKDYWYSFATIMTISVAGLFFFAKGLMWITETLDNKVKLVGKHLTRIVASRGRRRDKEKEGAEDSD